MCPSGPRIDAVPVAVHRDPALWRVPSPSVPPILGLGDRVQAAVVIAAAASMSARWLNAWRKLAHLALPGDVVLLREQAEVVGQAERSLEQLARLVEPPVQCQRGNEPERAGQNWPSLPGNPSSVSAVE